MFCSRVWAVGTQDCRNVHSEWQCSAAQYGRSAHKTDIQAVIDVSALRRVHWYIYRHFGVTPCSLVVIDVSALIRSCWQTVIDVSALRRVHWYSYWRFGVTPCSLVQLLTFRRYAVPAGKHLSRFRLYAVFTGTVIDVSALRRVCWQTVIDVSKGRSAFTFGSPSPGRVSAEPYLQQRPSQNLTHFRRSPRRTFVQNCVNVTCRAGPERRHFLTCCSMCVNNILWLPKAVSLLPK